MRTRWLSILGAAVAVLLPVAASAGVDAPHDGSGTDGDCNNCHNLVGGTTSYTSLCQSCHATQAGHGFPWADADQAAPGVGGNQHSWTGASVNPTYGASTPTSAAVTQRLDGGKLQCVVCHNPHFANPAAADKKTSIPLGTPQAPKAGGAARMTLVSAGTAAKGYALKIQAGGTSFVISHDYKLATPSWFNWTGSAWAVGTADGPGRPFTPGVAVATDDPATTVSFTGAAAGDQWEFRITYPMLRLSAVNDAACYDCHRTRVMKHTRVRGLDGNFPANGANLFSHPVDQALNANGLGLDRLPAEILDANGVPQGTGDAKLTNDLVLQSGLVRCTTCHAVHNADSNSISEDPR
jgi:hypothetical protein